MIIGDPCRFAFLIERVPQWESGYFNGLMFLIVNDSIYPKEVRTTTLCCELSELLDAQSVLRNPVIDTALFRMETAECFRRITEAVYPEDYEIDNDYRYLIPFHEINDSGFSIFAVSDGENVRILVGEWEQASCSFVEETVIGMQEYCDIAKQLQEYEQGMRVDR